MQCRQTVGSRRGRGREESLAAPQRANRQELEESTVEEGEDCKQKSRARLRAV